MKKPIFILILVTACIAVQGQYFYSGAGATMDLPRTQFKADSSGNLRFVPGDFGFSMSVGAGMSAYSGGTSFGTYVAPAFAYNVSERFRLKAGVSMMNNFANMYYPGGESYLYPAPVTATRVFVQADYLLSNKLMISGAVYKDFTPFNPRISDPRYKPASSEGVLLNLNYRPTRNVEINATFEYSNGNRPYGCGYHPFSRPGLNQPGSPW